MGARAQTFSSDLTASDNTKSRGKIIVRAESLNKSKIDVQFKCNGQGWLNR